MTRKILSIDDSKMVHMVIAKTLRPFGIEVITASDGEEVSARARKEKPDLILLDATMPVMDGMTTLEKLKNDEVTRGVPVVMLSADSCQENRNKARELGAVNFVGKPFTSESLLDGLKGLIELQTA